MSEKNGHNENVHDGISVDDLEEHFQALADELKVVEPKKSNNKNTSAPHYRNYNPSVIDFLARAKTFAESEQIIAFCLKQGEITENLAKELKDKLLLHGPEGFGERKSGYYNEKL